MLPIALEAGFGEAGLSCLVERPAVDTDQANAIGLRHLFHMVDQQGAAAAFAKPVSDDQLVDVGEPLRDPEQVFRPRAQEILDVSDRGSIDAGQYQVLFGVFQNVRKELIENLVLRRFPEELGFRYGMYRLNLGEELKDDAFVLRPGGPQMKFGSLHGRHRRTNSPDPSKAGFGDR